MRVKLCEKCKIKPFKHKLIGTRHIVVDNIGYFRRLSTKKLRFGYGNV